MSFENAINDIFDDKIIIPSVGANVFGDQGNIIEMLPSEPGVYFEAPEIELDTYDYYIVCTSSGKDSWASLFYLLERGVPKDKILLWHHLIDGKEDPVPFMDWAYVDNYCSEFAKSMGIRLEYSWLQYGFKGELLKENSKPHNHIFETPDGLVELDRKLAKPGTRMLYPQQEASLLRRWCSSSLKIDVCRRAINNQERFIGKRTLVVTGERREESGSRSKFNQLEPHHCDTLRANPNSKKPRYVDTWRPVLHLKEEQIWEILERWRVIPPIAYRLGWNRSSCIACIFNSDKVFATIREYFPDQFYQIYEYERSFEKTIHRNGKNILERTEGVKPFECLDKEALKQAIDPSYKLPIFLADGEQWKLPPGAFNQESAGAI